MARRLWVANLSAGEVRTDRVDTLGDLFEVSARARSKNRSVRHCAVRDMVTVLEQVVRHCIASVIDEGRAQPPGELTIRTEDVPRAAGLSLGIVVSLAFTVSSTRGMRARFQEFGLPNPFAGDPDLEARVQALLESRHLITHRLVYGASDAAAWYDAVVEVARRLFAALPHGEIDFCLALADSMNEARRPKEAARWYARAESLCAKAVADGQISAEVPTRRGLALAGMDRHEDAVASYDEAIAANPRYALAHLNRGIALARLGRHEDAIASYDEAIEHDPSLARAHHSKARALDTLDRSSEALKSYDAAAELGGPAADAHTDKGSLYARLGRSGKALAAYDAAIKSDPYAARAYLKKGLLLYRMGSSREAAECYNDAIEIDGGADVAAESYAGRGEIAYDKGRLAEALADYSAAIAIDPELAIAHAGMASVLAAMGRAAGALDSYDLAFRAGPARAEELVHRGRTQAQPDSNGRGGNAGRDGGRP